MSRRRDSDDEEEQEIIRESFFAREEPFDGSIAERKSIAIPETDAELDLIEHLQAKWKRLQGALEVHEEPRLGLQDLVEEGKDIATVRKESVFASDVTAEEQEIIKQRIALQRKQFDEFEKRDRIRKVAKVRMLHPYCTEEEVVAALKETKEDEDEAALYLNDYFKLAVIRKNIAIQAQSHQVRHLPAIDLSVLIKKRKQHGSKSRKSAKETNSTFERLRLDDALQRENYEGWSEARIRAYQVRESNPNAYYYRFNDPGEAQKNGKWDKHEVALFYARMKEVGVNGQWGIFSRTIPGRVGYQCSNFYRQLLESGQIEDPNYFLDEKGKAHYVFKKKEGGGKQRNGAAPEPMKRPRRVSTGSVPGKKKGTKRKRSSRYYDSDEEMDDGAFDDEDDPSFGFSRRRKDSDEELGEEDEKIKKKEKEENPLPGFTDPITLDEVVKPAISPQGIVMSYTSWSRVLSSEPRNRCPFTKQTVKKRDLIVLTWENIEEHKSKIKNASDLAAMAMEAPKTARFTEAEVSKLGSELDEQQREGETEGEAGTIPGKEEVVGNLAEGERGGEEEWKDAMQIEHSSPSRTSQRERRKTKKNDSDVYAVDWDAMEEDEEEQEEEEEEEEDWR